MILSRQDIDDMTSRRDVDGLIRALGCRESAEVRQRAAQVLGEIGDARAVEPLIAALKDAEWAVRAAAAQALGELGNPPLSRLLSSDFTPEEIGIERAVQPLIAALADEDLGVRCAVIEVSSRIRDEGTTEPLIGLLTDENEEVRCAAIRALGRMGDAQAVQPLRAVLGQHPYVVANALSRFGAAGIESLVSALGEANPDIRRAAAWALGKIGDLTAVQPLVAMLRHEDRETAFSAAEALREMVTLNVKPFIEARDSPTAAREIEERFGSPEMVNLLLSMLVSYTERSLVLGGQITDPVSLAWIGDAYRNPDRALRGAVSAAYALGAIQEKRAVRPLLKALEDRDTDLRRAALWALGQIGDSSATEALLAALKDMEVSAMAAWALERMGWQPVQEEEWGWYWLAKRAWREPDAPNAERMTEVFCKLLQDENWEARQQIARALREMGTVRAVEPLGRVALEDENKDVRFAAILALGRIGHPAAIELLLTLIRNGDSLALDAASALGELGDTRAVESLLALLESENSLVRESAALALGKIGDTRAVEKLLPLLKDENSQVRCRAAQSLEQLGWQAGQNAEGS